MAETTPPIVVPASAIPAATLAMIRYALATIGGALLVKRGIISDGELQELVGFALVIIPAAYGMWLTHRDNKKQKAMADELPDTKALVQR